MLKKLGKIAKYTGIVVLLLLLMVVLAPYILPNTVSQKIKQLANESLTTELNFSKARLSFIRHFPKLTLSLYDVNLKGSAPFNNQSLLTAKEIALGIDLTSIFSSNIKVDEIFVDKGIFSIQTDSLGHANYNIYKTSAVKAKPSKDSSTASLKIEKIRIASSQLTYNDASLPMLVKANGLNYTGKGDLSKAVFDLASKISIDSIDFSYNNQSYFISKQLSADLITKINTQSLSFIFEKNDLLINQLPVNFKGNFSFLSNGYDMNFDVQSEATQLYNVLTALPIEYIQHFKKVDLKGTADMYLNLSGKYIAETNTMPGLTAAIGIRSGFIKEEKAPAPISNLFLNFQAKLPSFDKEQMEIAVDSLFFNIDKDYFSTVTRIKGFSKPHIYTKTDANISLEKWNKALGELPFTVKGNLGMQLNANGYWAEKVVQRNLRKQDTITSSIPVFDGKLALQNGYFKWANLPKAIENIYCSVKANCKDSIYQHAELQIDSVHLQAGSNFVKGKATLKGKQQWHTQAKFDGNLALQELKDIIHLPGYELGGNISLQMLVNGILAIEKQVYPIAKAHIEWQNGLLKTPYYPNAIEKIQVETDIVSKSNSPKQVSIAVKPIAFSFENQPFTLKANLSNLNNLKYDLSSKGKIDIGKIYKVFAYQGWDVQGIIATNLQLKGLQSDATAGLYEKLTNKGFIKVQNLWLNSYLYPHPFVISNGKFSFLQDKCWFDSVQARYQKSDFGVKGYVTNMVNYWLKNETIEGGFEVYSNNLAVDEFMAFAETQTGISTKNATKEGVIMLPKNMHLSLVAHAKKVNYMGLGIQNLEGNVKVEKGKLLLKNTSFSVAGANANMEGSYQSLSPWKAQFDYQVKLDNFDIQRVYKEVTLIQQLASSTKFIKGNASLNYLLSGKINKEMMPIFPSLKGNGSIEATNVSILGMKLFTAVSKATGRDSIASPKVKKVVVNTRIANNIITIDPVKMRFMGFRPKFSGQVSFDGDLNLKFRLGLPPLGIFGIPMNITGNQNNPIIRLGRGKNNEPLTERSGNEENEPEED